MFDSSASSVASDKCRIWQSCTLQISAVKMTHKLRWGTDVHPCNKVSCVVLRKSEVNVLDISVNQHTNEMSAHISLICILQKRKQMLSEVNPCLKSHSWWIVELRHKQVWVQHSFSLWWCQAILSVYKNYGRVGDSGQSLAFILSSYKRQ